MKRAIRYRGRIILGFNPEISADCAKKIMQRIEETVSDCLKENIYELSPSERPHILRCSPDIYIHGNKEVEVKR